MEGSRGVAEVVEKGMQEKVALRTGFLPKGLEVKSRFKFHIKVTVMFTKNLRCLVNN